MNAVPPANDQPAGDHEVTDTSAQTAMNPGDEAPTGTPGTGENVCPRCGGSGKQGTSACPDCGGTGRVNVNIGDA